MTDASRWERETWPTALLAMVRSRPGSRKQRLVGCAALRRVWHVLCPLAQQVIELAETAAYPRAVALARQAATADAMNRTAMAAWRAADGHAADALYDARMLVGRASEAAVQSHIIREIIPHGRVPHVPHVPRSRDVVAVASAAYDDRMEDGTLDPVLLAVLADAMEDAGADPMFAQHLRRDTSMCPHYRGCWAVDAALGAR